MAHGSLHREGKGSSTPHRDSAAWASHGPTPARPCSVWWRRQTQRGSRSGTCGLAGEEFAVSSSAQA